MKKLWPYILKAPFVLVVQAFYVAVDWLKHLGGKGRP